MLDSFILLVRFGASIFRTRAGLQAENLALRHQLCVLQRSVERPRIQPADRLLWSLLSRIWSRWEEALIFVKPDTVIRWQRRRFKEHWAKLSRQVEPGRPATPKEIQELIRTISRMNHTWGAPFRMSVGYTITSRGKRHDRSE